LYHSHLLGYFILLDQQVAKSTNPNIFSDFHQNHLGRIDPFCGGPSFCGLIEKLKKKTDLLLVFWTGAYGAVLFTLLVRITG